MAYQSPITLVEDLAYKVIEDKENNVIKVLQQYGINIDKDELFKLLLNDRQQYEKGYAEGKAAAVKHGHWVEVPDEVFASTYYCSECKGEAIPDIYGEYLLSNWCYYCGAKMDEVE